MTPEERIVFIQTHLKAALSPQYIAVEDESARHAGHKGHGGGGHYQVTIVAEAFNGKSLLERHRMVYSAVQEGIGQDIHALSIKAYTPQENPLS
ncbi:transcriptional regulator, BolA protein family [Nitrosococcus oceani ATCC 19707]|uniref:Transcriptional regulator, BolA protein family n=2 Tax=Nitrosococcus oceani TaxID=1229 RepID=Q3J8K1_NITOC|nr:BolA family protein [Nitrosococcus oceani]ABA58845.1 transcriptional regulator, BolA protein family [Nitrosococcus oceani ATCC 19707]EDZ67158.1 BolA-like protein [Nitrosococcus oceani AFC27]KFI18646.1 BolA family transcriptional regulator [Nitrosococcus oceani C-27]GEM19064.1 BolA family transcriptional regulator [Nitrosococcus oceani]